MSKEEIDYKSKYQETANELKSLRRSFKFVTSLDSIDEIRRYINEVLTIANIDKHKDG